MDLSRYAELFRSESREHLARIESEIQLLHRDRDIAHVAELFRSTHTIKGMAAAMGYAGVEQLAHALESFLDGLRSGLREIDDDVLRTVIDGADALATAIDNAVTEATTPPEEKRRASFAESTEQDEAEAERSASLAALTTVRVDLQRLDALLDLAGELVVARDRLLQASEKHDALHGTSGESRTGTHPLAAAIHETTNLITSLQDEVLRLRLVPVHQVFDRFPRLVRDIAREVGKDVALVTEGRDLELDRSLLESLGDPIVHLLRNAIDHGIESSDERLAWGKPRSGRLVLRARRDRNAIVVEVEDDGRGIDRNAVLARGRERGILGYDTESIDDDQLLQVIAQPGLSTADTVTSLSGRGVGIDVVVTRIRSLGGSVELESEPGQGTRFTLRLPTTLAITRALLVSAGGEHFALSAAHVVDVHEWSGTGSSALPETVSIRESEMPLVPLEMRFGLPPGSSEERHIVVVDAGTGRRALLVDEITGHQDIVVKRFQSVKDAEPWFSGATLLGDGRPALIVDLSSLT